MFNTQGTRVSEPLGKIAMIPRIEKPSGDPYKSKLLCYHTNNHFAFLTFQTTV